MWQANEATYNEQTIFGVTPDLQLMQRLLAGNPALVREGSLYAAICILGEGLEPLPEDALPPPEERRHSIDQVVAECFGEDTVFSFARAGRTLVFTTRSTEDMAVEQESAYRDHVIRGATRFASAVEAELGIAIALSVGPIFERLEDCEHAAGNALIMADFIRFIEVPVAVVDEKYYNGMKQVIRKQHPDYRLDNYERPMISALLNGNLSHAELIVNNLLTAHLLDPLFVFPTLRATMVNTVRMCMSMICLDPRALSDSEPRLPKLQKAMHSCDTVTEMRMYIHALFDMLDEYIRNTGTDAALDEKLQRIVSYINENSHNPMLSATTICDTFSLSASYFSRVFKERIGVNFSAYLQTLRMMHAKELMRDTAFNIDSIAQQVGCLSGQNLLRLFKKYEGVSPSAYKSLAAGMSEAAEREPEFKN